MHGQNHIKFILDFVAKATGVTCQSKHKMEAEE